MTPTSRDHASLHATIWPERDAKHRWILAILRRGAYESRPLVGDKGAFSSGSLTHIADW